MSSSISPTSTTLSDVGLILRINQSTVCIILLALFAGSIYQTNNYRRKVLPPKKSFSATASISQGSCRGNRPCGLTRLTNSGITFSAQSISIQPNPDRETEHSPVTVSRQNWIEIWRYRSPRFLIADSRYLFIFITPTSIRREKRRFRLLKAKKTTEASSCNQYF